MSEKYNEAVFEMVNAAINVGMEALEHGKDQKLYADLAQVMAWALGWMAHMSVDPKAMVDALHKDILESLAATENPDREVLQ